MLPLDDSHIKYCLCSLKFKFTFCYQSKKVFFILWEGVRAIFQNENMEFFMKYS